jgi:hypothetical protein
MFLISEIPTTTLCLFKLLDYDHSIVAINKKYGAKYLIELHRKIKVCQIKYIFVLRNFCLSDFEKYF